jgi:dienelactone hydrolase
MINKTRDLICTHAGVTLKGKMALPTRPGPHPTVVVMHTGLGLTEFIVERITHLAQLGYAAIATDMYGDGANFSMDNKSDAGVYFAQFLDNHTLLRSRVVHWFEHIKNLPEVDASRLAAVGYCFGGQCALELARSGADVKAVVSFHGLLNTESPAQIDQVSAKIAVYTGGKDPHVPRQHLDAFRAEMDNAQADYQITLFSNVFHSFTDPNADQTKNKGTQYDALATQLSWDGMLTLLNATIGARSTT